MVFSISARAQGTDTRVKPFTSRIRSKGCMRRREIQGRGFGAGCSLQVEYRAFKEGSSRHFDGGQLNLS